MIVFKAFLNVLNKNKSPIILFTIILVIFGTLNYNNNETSLDFTNAKPDTYIINEDEDTGITKDFIKYIESKTVLMDKYSIDEIDDALFYRDINYIIYIKKGFREDILNNKTPKIEIKSTGDYQASLADMIVKKYLSVLNVYKGYSLSEEEIIDKVNEALAEEVSVEVTSKLDTYSLSKITSYFNFMNYSLLAGLVFVISIILNSFKNKNINKRTVISSMNYKVFNRYLTLSNLLLALVLWVLYIILSFLLLGDVMFSMHALVCIVNSFIFMIVALVVAVLIGNVVNNKNAINGIVNVIALGSSFLCGAFVPVEFMPESVVKLSKILPSYYYINSNEIVKTLEEVNLNTLEPVIKNMVIMVIFIIGFIIINNIVTKRKRKYA